MRVRLEATTTDPRIFEVVIEFHGYQNGKYYPLRGSIIKRHDREVPEEILDKLLSSLNLRRIRWWQSDYKEWRARNNKRINTYKTTVISDRGLT